ncbi:MAG: type II and III secretion system protein family protein [Methylomicrobium sp.]
MLNFDSSILLKALPALLLGYSIQGNAVITTSADAKQVRYSVPINKSLLINLERPVVKLIQGKENIADVVANIKILSPRQILLRGNSIGATNATIWDAENHVAMVMDVEVTHNLDRLKEKLYELLPNETIEVRSVEKCIVLSGEVSNIVNMDYAMKIAQGYAMPQGQSGGGGQGCNGSPSIGNSGGGGGGGGSAANFIINMMHIGGEQQVMLEVKVAEITRELRRELTLNTASTNNTSREDGSFLWTVLSAGAGAFTGSYVAGDALFAWSLNFFRNTSLATVLAEPNLTTLSGKKASFLSGGEFPYTSCVAGQGTTGIVPCNVNFKPFGVGLEFTPVVLGSHRINLTTHVSVSALSNRANQVLTEGDQGDATLNLQPTPSLETREAVSTIELDDGQTLSIAGLMSENQTNAQEQTPGLADVPILGSFFRNRHASNDKKELLILATPHLAKPLPKEQIRLPTDNYVAPGDIDFYLLGRMEARKNRNAAALATVTNPASGGTTGQFGHQINDGGAQ